MSKIIELRLTAAVHSQLGQVLTYVLKSREFIGDGKAETAKLLIASWLPLAMQASGASAAEVRTVAAACIGVLEQQIYGIQRLVGLAPSAVVAGGDSEPVWPVAVADVEGVDGDGVADLADVSLLLDDEY